MFLTKKVVRFGITDYKALDNSDCWFPVAVTGDASQNNNTIFCDRFSTQFLPTITQPESLWGCLKKTHLTQHNCGQITDRQHEKQLQTPAVATLFIQIFVLIQTYKDRCIEAMVILWWWWWKYCNCMILMIILW